MTGSTKTWPAGSLGRRTVLAGGLATAATAVDARADARFPQRPLFVMAPSNPGGGTDQIARLMRIAFAQEHLSTRPLEVINRGGAGGAIGLAEIVSRHHGDPYMIMVGGGAIISSTIAQKSPFRLSKVEPLARLTVDDQIVAVPSDSPFRTIEDLAKAFRRDPRSITWCGGAAAGIDNITVALIAEACGHKASDLRYIAYSGGGAAIGALLGGQASAGVTGYSEWRALADEGRIRILASASAERFGAGLIPTLREAGIDVVQKNWRGLFAPPGLEPEHLAWWTQTIERMRGGKVWRDFLVKNGWTDGYLSPEAFGQFVRQEEGRCGKIIARLGIGSSAGGASPVGPYVFPAVIGAASVAAITATVLERTRGKGAPVAPVSLEDDDEDDGPAPPWSRFWRAAGLCLAYAAALGLVGFLIATPLFVMALSVFMRSRKPVRDGVVGVVLTLAVWLLFTRLLSVELP